MDSSRKTSAFVDYCLKNRFAMLERARWLSGSGGARGCGSGDDGCNRVGYRGGPEVVVNTFLTKTGKASLTTTTFVAFALGLYQFQ